MEAADRDLVVAVVQQHADSLLRVARRYTSCAADAEDAYQRALEIFVKNAHRLEAGGAHRWLHVVVRNEALAVRRSRAALVGVGDEATLDALDDARHVASVEERSERFDELSRAAEALQRLKPQEVTALWLKAQGLSYDEIAEHQGWTYTKVNRCITEGRRAFLRRYAGIEAGEECERWSEVLCAIADGEATAQQVLDARPHLRNCPACRASLAAMERGGRAVAALLPPVLVLPLGGPEAGVAARLGEVVGSLHDRAAGVAASLHDRAAGVAASLHDRAAGLAASLHDRAVGAAIKAQAAADALASGRPVAIAATAAALAGGGVAADRHLGEESARADSPAPAAVVPSGVATQRPGPPALPEPSGRSRPTPAPAPSGSVASSTGPGARTRGDGAPGAAAFAPEAARVAEGSGSDESTVPPPPSRSSPPTRDDPPRGAEFDLLSPEQREHG